MDSAAPPGANTLKSWMEENFFKKCCLMQVEFKQQQQKWKPSHARSRVNSNENGPSELKPQWPKRLKDRLKKKKIGLVYFDFGCPGSSQLCQLSLVAMSRGYSSLQYAGFSLW